MGFDETGPYCKSSRILFVRSPFLTLCSRFQCLQISTRCQRLLVVPERTLHRVANPGKIWRLPQVSLQSIHAFAANVDPRIVSLTAIEACLTLVGYMVNDQVGTCQDFQTESGLPVISLQGSHMTWLVSDFSVQNLP